MARTKLKMVRLTRAWDGHAAGETVEVEEMTAESMVAKDYGKILTATQSRRRRRAETTMAPPRAETMDRPPVATTGKLPSGGPSESEDN